MKQNSDQVAVGGQAVIEGVMMRGPERIAVAVRKSDGKILLKSEPFVSIVKKIKILDIPIFRGAIVLVETMILGVKALSFSGDVAMEEENNENNKRPKSKLNNIWMGLTLIFSLALGLVIFFYFPLLLTELFGLESDFLFNLVDGVIRLAIFLAYIYLISRWKEIRRVFEYHGAEHKSIFAYEDRKELTVESAKSYSTLHPRCGTSFLLIVMIVSIIVFMFLGKPTTMGERLLRLAFVPIIGGISYELIKSSAKGYKYKFFRGFIKPGLWLQKITTQEPDEKQLEVAMVALQSALGQDTFIGPSNIEIFSEDKKRD